MDQVHIDVGLAIWQNCSSGGASSAQPIISFLKTSLDLPHPRKWVLDVPIPATAGTTSFLQHEAIGGKCCVSIIHAELSLVGNMLIEKVTIEKSLVVQTVPLQVLAAGLEGMVAASTKAALR